MTNPLRRVATIAFAFVMAVTSVNLSGALQVYTVQAKSNNGTFQIHEDGTTPGTPSNAPKVCVFNFEVFGVDTKQTGDVTIVAQSPTPTITPVVIPLTTDDSGNGATSPYVNAAGSPYVLAAGHYKATLDNKFGTDPGDKAKSKVFKVECTPTAVTPTAPSKVDLCGTANDTYIIPTTTGVTYQINGQPVLAGTYPATGTVIVTAVANPGYVLQGGTSSWTLTFTNTPCIVAVTPPAPTRTDLCGTANDTYTIPAADGVIYRVNGNVKAAGTYAGSGFLLITATAAPGYVLSGTKTWTFLFTNLPCVVVPAEPTDTELCGRDDDTYTIPSTTGVRYFVNGVEKAAGTYDAPAAVLIVAVAKPGYIIDLHAQAAWIFTFSNKKCPEPCHSMVTLRFFGQHNWLDDEDCIPVEVTTVDPTKIDLCGVNGDSYTIPSKTGVIYKVNGVVKPAGTYPATGPVTITAHAADSGYVIANGQTTSWTFEFTNQACPKADIGIVAECSAQGVLVKLVNSGDADGDVYINGDKVTVAMGKTVEVIVSTVLFKANVVVKDADNKTILLDQAYDCTPGRGGAGPIDTPTIPAKVASVQMPGTDLPVTGADSAKQALMLIFLGIAVYGATYFLQGRLKLRENE